MHYGSTIVAERVDVRIFDELILHAISDLTGVYKNKSVTVIPLVFVCDTEEVEKLVQDSTKWGPLTLLPAWIQVHFIVWCPISKVGPTTTDRKFTLRISDAKLCIGFFPESECWHSLCEDTCRFPHFPLDVVRRYA